MSRAGLVFASALALAPLALAVAGCANPQTPVPTATPTPKPTATPTPEPTPTLSPEDAAYAALSLRHRLLSVEEIEQ